MRTLVFGALFFFGITYLAAKHFVAMATLWPDSWFLLLSLLSTLASSTYMGGLAVWFAFKRRDDERKAAEYAEHLRRVTVMPTEVEK